MGMGGGVQGWVGRCGYRGGRGQGMKGPRVVGGQGLGF